MRIIVLLLVAIVQTSLYSGDSFEGSFDLISKQSYKNGNVRYDTLNYKFVKDKTIMTIQARGNQPDVEMTFDFADSTISSSFIMNGKKGGYTLPMDLEHWPGLVYSEEKSQPEIDKSLESKSINGIKTYKISVSSDDYDADLWVTNKYNLSMLQLLSYQSVGKGKSRKELEMFEEFELYNLPMLMKLISKKGKADVEIRLENFIE